MSVILETSLGDLTIDLFWEEVPTACKSFVKLCKVKYYNNCLFYNIQKDFIIQTGDPTNTGKGGKSIYGLLYGEQANFFEDEIKPTMRHKKIGTVAMANPGPNQNGSAFYITTSENLTSLDDKHTIFGEVSEGLETLAKLNDTYTDSTGKPVQIIRIRHTAIVFDPFDDPQGLQIPDRSPEPVRDASMLGLLAEDENFEGVADSEILERLEEKTAKARAEVLEILGDLPDADVKPPENVLFVCKLNAVTSDEDLELIFSRFGEVKSCEVIRDKKTGDSLNYAFIEFTDQKSCEEAYVKMNNVLIDDRRIHVDFSQSVSKQEWKGFRNWKQFYAARAQSKNSGPKGDGEPKRTRGFGALEMRGGPRGGGGGYGGARPQGYALVAAEDAPDLAPSNRRKRDRDDDEGSTSRDYPPKRVHREDDTHRRGRSRSRSPPRVGRTPADRRDDRSRRDDRREYDRRDGGYRDDRRGDDRRDDRRDPRSQPPRDDYRRSDDHRSSSSRDYRRDDNRGGGRVEGKDERR